MLDSLTLWNATMSPEEAKTLVFNYWDYLNNLARKRFPQDINLADQAVDYLLEKLEKDNWRRVCDYNGAGFTSYITVVATRLFIDFARKIGESPILPTWISERGGLWRKAYLLLHKGLSKNEILETLRTEALQLGYQLDYVRDIITTIVHKESFYAAPPLVSLDQEEIVETVAADMLNPLENLVENEETWLLDTFFLLVQHLQQDNPPSICDKGHTKLTQWIIQLREQVILTSEEFLFLTMIYRDGLTVSEAGRRLNMNVNQAQGRHRRLLIRLHEAFTRCGISAELQLLLE